MGLCLRPQSWAWQLWGCWRRSVFRQMVQERILIQKLDQEIQALKGPSDRVQAIRRRI